MTSSPILQRRKLRQKRLDDLPKTTWLTGVEPEIWLQSRMLHCSLLGCAVPNNNHTKAFQAVGGPQKKRVTGSYVEGGSQGRPLGGGDICAEA